MSAAPRGPINDPATVLREYASEDRFLERRLANQAELIGPLVEDAALEAMQGARRLLEIGCGTGDFSARVAREIGCALTALDLSHRMAALARSRGLESIRADAQQLPLNSSTFDCVLANRMLYHLPDLALGLAEIARVLAPGGKLVAVTYSQHHLAELSELVGNPTIATTFSSENGESQLKPWFASVERRDIAGTARFHSREAITALLTAYGDFSPIDMAAAPMAARLGEVRLPFDATYRHALFVATTSTA